MALLQCQTCGGKLKIEDGEFIATCEYCGSQMTVFESTAEFEIDSHGVLVQYNGSNVDIVIPDEVLAIGAKCFNENERLRSVKLPESIKKIGEKAFRKCISLESINLPESIETIEVGAFLYCSSLKSITVPSKVIALKEYVFSDCDNLEEITIPESIIDIGPNAFENCSTLESITLPSSLKRINDAAFLNAGITSITIPDGIAEIPYRAFDGCKNLKEIKIGASVKKIGKYAFDSCDSLKELIIPDSVREIEATLNAKRIIIGNGLKKLPKFGRNVEYVQLSEGIDTIPDRNFNVCVNLKEINIPNSVEKIEEFAFYDCSKLEKVTFGSIEDSKLEEIGESAFNLCSKLREVILPDSVKTIGESAFFSCEKISKLRLPEGLESIEEYAFYECSSLREVNLGSSLTTLGKNAFASSGIKKAYIPGTVEVIEESAFRTNTLEEVFVGEGCRVIRENGLYENGTETECVLHLPSTIEEVESDAIGGYSIANIYIDCPASNTYLINYCNQYSKLIWRNTPTNAPVIEEAPAKVEEPKIIVEEVNNETFAADDIDIDDEYIEEDDEIEEDNTSANLGIDMELELLRLSRREKKLCQYCGGKFKGLFSKTCSSCGMPKDY